MRTRGCSPSSFRSSTISSGRSPAAEEHEEAQLEEGVRLVHRSLAALLERHGITPIETDGKFDPHVHEALLSQPSEEASGSVLDVVQKGYKLGERVVRPARVIVAAAS